VRAKPALWLALLAVLFAWAGPLAARAAEPPLVLPAEVELPAVGPSATKADEKGPGSLVEMDRLFGAFQEMQRRLSRASETMFYIGRRHVKLFHYGEAHYLDAVKWVDVYRNSVRKLTALPVSMYLDRPERFLELKDALEWGRLHAIGEPWYYKIGYRRAKIVLP
jgi:hypothetical protein